MPAVAPPPAPPPRRGRSVVRGGGRAVAALFRPAGRRFEAARAAGDTRTRVLSALVGAVWAGLGLGVLGAVALVLFALVLWPFTPGRASVRHARELHPSVVVAANGDRVATLERSGRTWTPLEDVSPVFVSALLATEDRRFYTHGGVDVVRTGGAVLKTLTGTPQGGSTITQQLARNLYPRQIGRSRSVVRKLKEAITAWTIESVYSKDEILEIYLNTVPYLYDAVGVERAAQTYFQTPASRLDTLQSALLVGMLKGTSLYNPVRHPERAQRRRDAVLASLVTVGEMTPSRALRLGDVPLRLNFRRLERPRNRAPHFVEAVRIQAEAWADDEGVNLYGDGLTVHTTLNPGLQEAALEAVVRYGDGLQAVADVEWGRAGEGRLGTTTEPYVAARRSTAPFSYFWNTRRQTVDQFVRESDAYREAVAEGTTAERALDSLRADAAFMEALRETKTRLDVGFAAIDPETGYVLAYVGSRNSRRTPFDHVAMARRQPGSTFKPFVYARALEEGFRPDDTLPNEPVEMETESGEVWRPRNADGGDVAGEEVTLRTGLVRSVNTAAAQLIEAVGPGDVARTARRMGVLSPLDAVPSLALGTSEVTLLEMTSAYATIADGGLYRPPVLITHITDRDGNEVARFAPDPRRALDPSVALTLVDMMRDVVDSGTGRGLRNTFGVRGDYAGKTGTTQNGADGWFLAMHPDVVAGAWVGFDDPRVAFRSSYWEQGGHNALRVVGDFLQSAERRRLIDRGARFPEAPPLAPSFADRAGRLIGDAFAAIFQRDESQAPPVQDTAPPPGQGRPPERPRRDEPEPPPDAFPPDETVDDILPDDVVDEALDGVFGEPDPAPENRIEERIREAARGATEGVAREAINDARRAAEAEAARFQRDAERLADRALREADPAVREDLERAAREARRQAERVLNP
ncbi:MAG TPA: transglycosylase domain-containing protein [Rubricoccaceae bacterium]